MDLCSINGIYGAVNHLRDYFNVSCDSEDIRQLQGCSTNAPAFANLTCSRCFPQIVIYLRIHSMGPTSLGGRRLARIKIDATLSINKCFPSCGDILDLSRSQTATPIRNPKDFWFQAPYLFPKSSLPDLLQVSSFLPRFIE